jgi:hypothetical protein
VKKISCVSRLTPDLAVWPTRHRGPTRSSADCNTAAVKGYVQAASGCTNTASELLIECITNDRTFPRCLTDRDAALKSPGELDALQIFKEVAFQSDEFC